MLKQLFIAGSLLGSMNLFGSYAPASGAHAQGNPAKKEASDGEKVWLGTFWTKVQEYIRAQSDEVADRAMVSLEAGVRHAHLERPYIQASMPEKGGRLISIYEQLEEEMHFAIIEPRATELQVQRLQNVKNLFDNYVDKPFEPLKKGRSGQGASWGIGSKLVVGLSLLAIAAWVVNSQMKKDRK